MTLILWAVIATAVLLSVLLVYMEHEWGLVLGGITALVLISSYFLVGLVVHSPLVVLLPQGAASHLDAMAVIAGVLLVLALIVVAYLAGRSSASKKKP
jgi:hypothetical protein